jgi:hypothetical protein
MLREDYDAFSAVMKDLCTAFDKPVTDDRVRVFWETLKHVHLHDFKRLAETWKNTQRKFPTPRDLKPERQSAPPPKPVDDGGPMSRWAVAANKLLLAVAYQDANGRGFRPIAKWQRMPEKGWGLPLPRPDLIDGSLLDRVVAVKRDYVQMAEQAAREGEPMDGDEFQAMCREGFAKVLAA